MAERNSCEMEVKINSRVAGNIFLLKNQLRTRRETERERLVYVCFWRIFISMCSHSSVVKLVELSLLACPAPLFAMAAALHRPLNIHIQLSRFAMNEGTRALLFSHTRFQSSPKRQLNCIFKLLLEAPNFYSCVFGTKSFCLKLRGKIQLN